MAFDVFDLRDRVVGEYEEYFRSFVQIQDPRIQRFADEQFQKGEPWPDAVLQLNPSFVRDETLEELAGQGIVTPDTARFFGSNFRLYRHQREALDRAQRGQSYVVTTGTGSGKSWTYLIPLIDHVFRDRPDHHSVRAIIVYPMNALINSQLDALTRSQDEHWPEAPVTFARYTGQEKRDDRQAILDDPPHILLTNYVMLEYILVRTFDRSLLKTATSDLTFLVVDEMHNYRGRQGADVAMLLRRVNQKAGGRLQFVGTSATVSSEGTAQERAQTVAGVGATLFGVPVDPENVIGEALETVATGASGGHSPAEAVRAEAPGSSSEAVRGHPLTPWIERTFGVTEIDGVLARQRPTTFQEGVRRLATESGLEEGECSDALRVLLDAGSQAKPETEGDSLFAFRLHQFLASGRTIYATLEPAEERMLTVTAGYRAPTPDGADPKLLFPLAFCRECGKEYYLVSRTADSLLPRAARLSGFEDEVEGDAGYFTLDEDRRWADDPALPDSWYDELRSGPRLKSGYARRAPVELTVAPDGSLLQPNGPKESPGRSTGYFLPRPFTICLSCRTVYELRMTSDFVKLTTLSQTGRSTATTITTAAATAGMTRADVDPRARKVLSFTDNRQDASFQAGHLNDFVQIARIRGALARGLRATDGITGAELGRRVFDELDPDPDEYMLEPVASGPGAERA